MDYNNKNTTLYAFYEREHPRPNFIDKITDNELNDFCRVFFKKDSYDRFFCKEALSKFQTGDTKGNYKEYRKNILYASILKINSSFYETYKEDLSFSMLLENLFKEQIRYYKEYCRIKLVKDYKLPYHDMHVSDPGINGYSDSTDVTLYCPVCSETYTTKFEKLHIGGLCAKCFNDKKRNVRRDNKKRLSKKLSKINKEIKRINGKYCYLYIMFDKNTPDIKIGISIDPLRRSKVLAEDIEYDKSVCIRGEDKCIRNAEKAVHHTFYKYNRSYNHYSTGHTEWFCAFQFDSILNFLKLFFGLKDFIPIKQEEDWYIKMFQIPERIFYKIYSKPYKEPIITEIREDSLTDEIDVILLGDDYGDVYMITKEVTQEKLEYIKKYTNKQARLMLDCIQEYLK